jgi:HAD superfamily hydrolase (TIGR01549 family)
MLFGEISNMKLVIFDLDQTLVDFFTIHDKAYHKTMQEVFGIKACYKKLDHTGKRIPDLITEYALREGVSVQVVGMNLDEAVRVYELAFEQALRNPKGHVLRGVYKLLDALKTKHKLALVTGDLPLIVRAVLKTTGLARYFPTIITCLDAKTRPEMVAKAIKKAGRVEEVWVIGDSTRDIDAAKANGAKAIGVMTGEHDKKMLGSRGADYIFKDLSPTAAILKVIG